MFFFATVKNTKGEGILGVKADTVSLSAVAFQLLRSLTSFESGKRTETVFTMFSIKVEWMTVDV